MEYYRREAAEALGQVGDLEAKVCNLKGKAAGLEQKKRMQESQIQVMSPLAWTGCLLRLGRPENAAKHWISEHGVNEDIITWRNSSAQDADIAADLALLQFVERYPGVDGKFPHFTEIRGRVDRHHGLLKRQFERSILKTTKLIKNKNFVDLLTARGVIWGKRGIGSEARRAIPTKIDELIKKYEKALSGESSSDLFSEEGPVAADFEKVVLEAKGLLRRR